MLIGRIVDRPARMLAGVHAVKLSVADGDVMNVAGAGHELHELDHVTGLDVVLDEARRIAFIAGRTFLLMAGYLPDGAVVICDAVQPLRDPGHAGRLNEVVDLPGFGIDADDRSQPVGVDPDLADVRLPRHAMGRAAIVLGTEGNLAMADLLAVHVGLEYPVDRRRGVFYRRCAVGAAPDIAVAIAHAAGVLAVGHHGFQQLAFPVDQPGGFLLVVMPLFLNPEPSLLVMVDVDRIGPAGRRKKQLGGLRLPLWDLPSSRCAAPHPPAESVRSRFPARRLR